MKAGGWMSKLPESQGNTGQVNLQVRLWFIHRVQWCNTVLNQAVYWWAVCHQQKPPRLLMLLCSGYSSQNRASFFQAWCLINLGLVICDLRSRCIPSVSASRERAVTLGSHQAALTQEAKLNSKKIFGLFSKELKSVDAWKQDSSVLWLVKKAPECRLTVKTHRTHEPPSLSQPARFVSVGLSAIARQQRACLLEKNTNYAINNFFTPCKEWTFWPVFTPLSLWC